jgi:hypothetical protein
MQISLMLGDEDMAIEILDFVFCVSEDMDAKKVLYEFMGRVWGDGNTTLHLASFLGMGNLVKKLIQYGANTTRLNDRRYKPVDCAGDDQTIDIFKTYESPIDGTL